MSFSRRQILRIAAVSGTVAPLAAACSDDEGGDAVADTGSDTADAGADSGGDAGLDTGTDTGDATDVDDLGPPDDLPQYEHEGELGPETLFEHGVASGDPLPDAVILWTRVSPPTSGEQQVWYEISRDVEFTRRVAVGWITTDESVDYTVKIDVTALRPGTTYFYRFFAYGRQSPIGRTRTAPDGAVSRLRFAVTSCASGAHGYFLGYRALAQRADLDLIVQLGDYIYEYGTGEYGNVREYEPPNEILTLADYRLRYSWYRRDPDLQEVHRQHPFVNVWDDHESADNSWSGGASNHNGGEGEWTDRISAARQVYAEWLPIREQPDGRIWRAFRYGDLVDLIMLDTRIWGRDEQVGGIGDTARFDEERQLLGADQEAWLFDQLRNATGRWKVLGQQVMMGQYKTVGAPNSEGGGAVFNIDQWDGYVAARERLFDVLRTEGVENLVVFTGDIHSSWAMELTSDPNNPDAYDPATSAGSLGVEFVTPAISSPGFPRGLGAGFAEAALLENPHLRYAELESRGYIVLDITPERVQGAFFHFEDVVAGDEPEAPGAALSVADGTARLEFDDAAAEPPAALRPLAP